MPSRSPVKHFALAFVIALVLYLITYHTIEHLRTRHGPWQVTFTNQSGAPALVINEPQLNLANITISFPGQSASFTNQTIRFNPPQDVPFDLPFGQCKFEDTTFQPGTIVIIAFGHEIQLMPRVLTIDRKEFLWMSDHTLQLTNRGILADSPDR
jgi:hypothetical protein